MAVSRSVGERGREAAGDHNLSNATGSISNAGAMCLVRVDFKSLEIFEGES